MFFVAPTSPPQPGDPKSRDHFGKKRDFFKSLPPEFENSLKPPSPVGAKDLSCVLLRPLVGLSLNLPYMLES